LVRLADAEVLVQEFVIAPSPDEVSEQLLHSGNLPIV